jgi:hypothetical protein
LKQPQNGACPAKQLCERGEAKVPSARRNIVFWIFGGGFIGSLISFQRQSAQVRKGKPQCHTLLPERKTPATLISTMRTTARVSQLSLSTGIR